METKSVLSLYKRIDTENVLVMGSWGGLEGGGEAEIFFMKTEFSPPYA